MPYTFRGELTGLKSTLRRLSDVKAAVGRKILRKVLGQASKSVLKTAKGLTPVDTGLLRKSLGRKVKVYRRSGVVVAIVGPRSGFKQQVTRQGRFGPRSMLANPTQYAHLVELGTKRAAAKPFLSRAWKQQEGTILAIVKDGIRAELAKLR